MLLKLEVVGMRCCNLLNGQTESYLMLLVKVMHSKQPYPVHSAQGSLPRVYSESGGVCLKKE